MRNSGVAGPRVTAASGPPAPTQGGPGSHRRAGRKAGGLHLSLGAGPAERLVILPATGNH